MGDITPAATKEGRFNMLRFICDYAKISSAVLENMILKRTECAWVMTFDIDEDSFLLDISEPFGEILPEEEKILIEEIVKPYLYK